MRQHQANKPPSPRQFLRQVRDVFRNKSARLVAAGGVLYYAGVGTYVVLWVYIYSYFWEFSSEQISIIVIPMSIAALFLPPALARWAAGREKKNVAIFGLLGGMATNIIPISLALLGWFPANGSDALFYIMVVTGFFETALFLVFDICWRSMISDLTERTGTGHRAPQ